MRAMTTAKSQLRLRRKDTHTIDARSFAGNAPLPYFREEVLGDRLGKILLDIHIPDAILEQLQKLLLSDKGREEATRRTAETTSGAKSRPGTAETRSGLPGQTRRQNQRRVLGEEVARMAVGRNTSSRFFGRFAGGSNPERLLDAARILELANKAYFLYVKQTPEEKAKLLKMVLSNCAIDAVSIYPAIRKPFDLIFQKVKTEEWRARRDSNSRPSGS